MIVKYVKSDENELPKCPHCEKDLPEIKVTQQKRVWMFFSKTYFCPHCKKVLGVGCMK
jgi:uncharacterized protein with PIN domain